MACFLVRQNTHTRRTHRPPAEEQWGGVVESIEFESGVPYKYGGRVSGDLQWPCWAIHAPLGSAAYSFASAFSMAAREVAFGFTRCIFSQGM